MTHCYHYLSSFLLLCVVCSGRVSMTQTGSLNLFSSKEQEFELRAQMLKRLSFAIFCSPPDQYQRNMPEIQGQWGVPCCLKCCMFTVCLDCGVFSVRVCVFCSLSVMSHGMVVHGCLSLCLSISFSASVSVILSSFFLSLFLLHRHTHSHTYTHKITMLKHKHIAVI